MATDSVQDYLKAIYVVSSYGQEVTTSRIAARLGASLVMGFAVHDSTEGLAIASPLGARRSSPPAVAPRRSRPRWSGRSGGRCSGPGSR